MKLIMEMQKIFKSYLNLITDNIFNLKSILKFNKNPNKYMIVFMDYNY